MTDNLHALDHWLTPLVKKLSKRERRTLMRKIAVAVRREQAERIKQQRNPEGTYYTPRKSARLHHGAIKHRAMFSKLRTARYLHVASTPDSATVEFRGRAARIARVHQYGLVDRVKQGSPSKVRYARRGLLGVSKRTQRLIEKEVLNYLG